MSCGTIVFHFLTLNLTLILILTLTLNFILNLTLTLTLTLNLTLNRILNLTRIRTLILTRTLAQLIKAELQAAREHMTASFIIVLCAFVVFFVLVIPDLYAGPYPAPDPVIASDNTTHKKHKQVVRIIISI